MIGVISGAYIAGRRDRRDGRRPRTAVERGETPSVHRFYLEGWHDFRWNRKAGFDQLELELVKPAS